MKKVLLPRLKLVVFQAAMIIVLLEIFLRVLGFLTSHSEDLGDSDASYYDQTRETWYPSWGSNAAIERKEPEFEYTMHTNSLGLREREIPVQKTDSMKRVFILGDSFTEGDGVDYMNSMPHILQTKLDSAHKHVEIFNLGVSGSDPFFEYTLLRDKLIRFKPDAVIVCTNTTDIDDYLFKGGFERFHKDGTTVYRKAPPKLFWIYKKSYAFRLFAFLLFQMDNFLLTSTQKDKLEEKGMYDIRQCLYMTRELCERNHIKLICVLHPIPESYHCDPVNDRIAKLPVMISRDSLSLIDLYGDFRPYLNEGRYKEYMWKENYHYNIKGYYLFGCLLFDHINREYPGFWD